MRDLNQLNRRAAGCLLDFSVFGLAVCGPAIAAETV